ncbi:hypothetical protein F5X68DRAFT_227420 [Plectosphaerella plurivora]|uniref:Actin-like ATPase domain-containing protein n=1 Tax=Plectosphaerella plurivora TaxID=936078 RepID=A0A9P8VK60_9PEZI|nr:hypothetical protein F5X68DRAFT_227420 [Plectosphaerella plurivora]
MTASSTLVVGLDIGTTFSGASWAQHEDGPSQREPTFHFIDSWPHKSGVAKVPTQIAFDTDTLQPNTTVAWGYAYLRDAKQFLINTEAGSGVNLMSQYLKVFWSHVMSSITQALGPDVVKSSHMKIVMTIPAIWPPYAVDRMSTAAKEAGIAIQNNSSLTFMTEPEAAALCNFQGDRRFMQQELAVDDNFVVCDAGGGTADLITYRVVQCSDSLLALEEVVPGKGGLCGAAFLDEAFEELLLEHFGSGWRSAQVYERRGVMEDAWERRIKPDFDGDDTLTHLNVLVPSSCQYYTRTSDRQKKLSDMLCASYEFTNDEIASVFEPIVTEITRLILEQIKGVVLRTSKKPKYIIMSGGFGQSKCLVQKVKAMLATESTDSVLLGMNSSSWSAVSRGAVLQGLAGSLRPSQAVHVRSRVSRGSYCTLQYETCDGNIHDQRDKRWSDEEGGYVGDDQTVWFLKYGDLINEGYSKRFEFYSMHPVSKGVPSSHTVSFFHCRDTEVPDRLGDTVKELCSIEWSDPTRSVPETFENGLGDDFYAV